jgi:hypothetical protein
MAGYSGSPLWKKLGYKTGLRAYLDGAPDNYMQLLELPHDVQVIWLDKKASKMPFVHLFERNARALRTGLDSYRKKIAADGVIWVSWPKKSSGVPTDISEDTVREVALPLGLVDIKVCAVDELWSGLKLVIRRENRQIKSHSIKNRLFIIAFF